ncbi:ABC transporter ATP-binding protein [Catellatospora sp. TT07R-123]|uniref:ATP-binding cassette domain-containing protein n=1 Tax=Catellatospora sp. TT07R-123 TaxID=2733863 RepID=UPI001B1AE5F1|nr:ATP-binding cassette domain-containing protein [Catellatospora sp. TT07R-123]GHJ49960.1 ABC transporter ATP-binding protein [Catellatospora sp. TT07R-123]
MTAVIEISGLRKTFHSVRRGRQTALDGFDMEVHAGQVHGFLGPNGSGKTTTLRTLLGLMRADSGTMRILGTPSERYATVAHRVGAIVESPAFFAGFSGRKTLQILATAGGVPATRVDEVLTTVGLRERADDLVKGYSLGMRQRLAVASALLKQPELLILDEPANGLDPAGIHAMRTLMSDLAAAGVTVLISSHLLAEIEQVCDSVTIISRGRRVTHGPVAQVLAKHATGEFRVQVGDPSAAVQLLRSAGRAARVDGGYVVVGGVDDPAWITQTLGEAGLWLAELVAIAPDLESVFLDLTDTRPAPGQPPQVQDVTPGDEPEPEPGPVAADAPAAVIDLDLKEQS